MPNVPMRQKNPAACTSIEFPRSSMKAVAMLLARSERDYLTDEGTHHEHSAYS